MISYFVAREKDTLVKSIPQTREALYGELRPNEPFILDEHLYLKEGTGGKPFEYKDGLWLAISHLPHKPIDDTTVVKRLLDPRPLYDLDHDLSTNKE